MTGYAALPGTQGAWRWDWEVRSVNGKGLDLRLRLAEGFEALEPVIRAAAAKRLKRGSVSVALKMRANAEAGGAALDGAALEAALRRVQSVADAAAARGLSLAPISAADLLSAPGVLAGEEAALPEAEVKAGIDALMDALLEMRAAEGQKLGAVVNGHLDAMAGMIDAARETAEARAARAGEVLKAKVAALLDAAEDADPARLSQELAILSVKADVTEELDRLDAHVAAARDLLKGGGPVGRKLDFLMQEFMREANTMCSKSGAADLTQIGLDLKVLIDQMREQVQNLE